MLLSPCKILNGMLDAINPCIKQNKHRDLFYKIEISLQLNMLNVRNELQRTGRTETHRPQVFVLASVSL